MVVYFIANPVVGIGAVDSPGRPISLTDMITARSVLNEMSYLSHHLRREQ